MGHVQLILKPSDIRWTQSSIKNSFGDGKMIGETLDELCERVCTLNDIRQIEVFKRDHCWWSLDNRRLWVFKRFERLGGCVDIPVICVIPTSEKLKKVTTNTSGTDIKIRGGDPGGIWHWKPKGALLNERQRLKSQEEYMYSTPSRTSSISSSESSYPGSITANITTLSERYKYFPEIQSMLPSSSDNLGLPKRKSEVERITSNEKVTKTYSLFSDSLPINATGKSSITESHVPKRTNVTMNSTLSDNNSSFKHVTQQYKVPCGDTAQASSVTESPEESMYSASRLTTPISSNKTRHPGSATANVITPKRVTRSMQNPLTDASDRYRIFPETRALLPSSSDNMGSPKRKSEEERITANKKVTKTYSTFPDSLLISAPGKSSITESHVPKRANATLKSTLSDNNRGFRNVTQEYRAPPCADTRSPSALTTDNTRLKSVADTSEPAIPTGTDGRMYPDFIPQHNEDRDVELAEMTEIQSSKAKRGFCIIS